MAQVSKGAAAPGDAAAIDCTRIKKDVKAADSLLATGPLARYPEVSSLQRYNIANPAIRGNASGSIHDRLARIGERSVFNSFPYVEQLCELVHLSLVQSMHSAAGDSLDAYSVGVGLPNPLESTASSVLLSLLRVEKEKCDWQSNHQHFTERNWRQTLEYPAEPRTAEEANVSAVGKGAIQTEASPTHTPPEAALHASAHNSRKASSSPKQDVTPSTAKPHANLSAQSTVARIAAWCSSWDATDIPSLARPCPHAMFSKDSLVIAPDDLHDPLSAIRCGLARAVRLTLLPQRYTESDRVDNGCQDYSATCFARPQTCVTEFRQRSESWHGIGSEAPGSKAAMALQEASRIRHAIEQSSENVKGDVDISFHGGGGSAGENQAALYSYYFTEAFGDELQNSAIVEWFYEFVLFCIRQSYAVIQVQCALLLAEEVIAAISAVGSATERCRYTDEQEDAAMEEAIGQVFERWIEDACVPQRCDLLTRQAVRTAAPYPSASSAADESSGQQRKAKQSIVRLNKGQKQSNPRDRDEGGGGGPDGTDGPPPKISSIAPFVFGMEDVVAPGVLVQPLFSEEQAADLVEHLCETALQHWRLFHFAACSSQPVQRTPILAAVNDVPSICIPPLRKFYATGEYQRLQERRALEQKCIALVERSFNELYVQPTASAGSEIEALNVAVRKEKEEGCAKDRSDALDAHEYQHTQRALELTVGKIALQNSYAPVGAHEEEGSHAVQSSPEPSHTGAAESTKTSRSTQQQHQHHLATFEGSTVAHPETDAALVFSADAVQARIEAANTVVDNMGGSKSGSPRAAGGTRKSAGK